MAGLIALPEQEKLAKALLFNGHTQIDSQLFKANCNFTSPT